MTSVPKIPHSLSIVMPVYNEGAVISAVLADFLRVLKRFEQGELIVVNDCSSDNTLHVLQGLADKNAMVRVLTNKRNLGHGPTLMRAYLASTGEYVFHCDSDNQFVAEDFWLLLEKLETEKLDGVIGFRQVRRDPFARLLLTRLVRVFLFLVFGLYLRDSNSPFRIWHRSALNRILPLIAQNARIPSIYMVVAAYTLKFRIGWVGVRHLSRETGKSFLRSFKIFKIVMTVAKEVLDFRRALKNASSRM